MALIIVLQECKIEEANSINTYKEVLHNFKEMASESNPYCKGKTDFQLDYIRQKRIFKIQSTNQCPVHLKCSKCKKIYNNINLLDFIAKDTVDDVGCSNQDGREFAIRLQLLMIVCQEVGVDVEQFTDTALRNDCLEVVNDKTMVNRFLRKHKERGTSYLDDKTFDLIHKKHQELLKPYGLADGKPFYESFDHIYEK